MSKKTPDGYRKLKAKEIIQDGDVYYPWGDCQESLKNIGAAHSSYVGKRFTLSDTVQIYRKIETTPKTKETKTMTTKKPGISHGKPTAKGLRVQPKATTKPKYPAPREALTYGVTVIGKTTKESIKGLLDMTIEIHNKTLQDLATTGTKLDRALVDLKEAKAKIKALEAAK